MHLLNTLDTGLRPVPVEEFLDSMIRFSDHYSSGISEIGIRLENFLARHPDGITLETQGHEIYISGNKREMALTEYNTQAVAPILTIWFEKEGEAWTLKEMRSFPKGNSTGVLVSDPESALTLCEYAVDHVISLDESNETFSGEIIIMTQSVKDLRYPDLSLFRIGSLEVPQLCTA